MSKKYTAEDALRDIIAEIVTPFDEGDRGEYLISERSKSLQRIEQIVLWYQSHVLEQKRSKRG